MKTRSVVSSFVAVALVAGSLSAQCSTLSITGSVNPGQTVAISVTGAPNNALTLLAFSENAGTTNLNLGPFGSLTLGVASPWGAFPLGLTNGSGSVSQSFGVPSQIPVPPSVTLHVQAVSVGFSLGGGMPSLNFCTSNVTTLQIGA